MSEIQLTDSPIIQIITLPKIKISIKQLIPFISVRCEDAAKTACTEESRQAVKALRAQLNKECRDLKERFKAAMAEVKAPITEVEELFKTCTAAYAAADANLKEQIDRVEDGIKKEKEAELKAYFVEAAKSLNLETVPFAVAVPKTNMSVSNKKYKEDIKSCLDGIKNDIKVISLEEYADEILVEYARDYDLTNAIYIVKKRHEAIDTARNMREANAELIEPLTSLSSEDEPLTAPTVEQTDQEDEEIIKLTFSIYGTLDQLKAFKPELIELIERHGLRHE